MIQIVVGVLTIGLMMMFVGLGGHFAIQSYRVAVERDRIVAAAENLRVYALMLGDQLGRPAEAADLDPGYVSRLLPGNAALVLASSPARYLCLHYAVPRPVDVAALPDAATRLGASVAPQCGGGTAGAGRALTVPLG